MKSADASNSFSPCTLLKRLVERSRYNSAILTMRLSVMYLGRFTAGTDPRWRRANPAKLNYPPRRMMKAMMAKEDDGHVPSAPLNCSVLDETNPNDHPLPLRSAIDGKAASRPH